MKANIYFYANPTSKGEHRPIMFCAYSIKFKSNRFLFSTGIYAEIGEWDSKGHIKDEYIDKYKNNKGESILLVYREIFEQLTNKGVYDKKELKAKMMVYKKEFADQLSGTRYLNKELYLIRVKNLQKVTYRMEI